MIRYHSHLGLFFRRHLAASAAIGLLLLPGAAPAQVAGSTVIGVAAAEMREVAIGWSAKRQVLGKAVFNDSNERIGTIDDIIIAPDRAVSYAIVGVGGFLGVARHDVAIPVSQLKLQGTKLILPGATKEALKATPAFEYGAPTS
jgi:sporulation protein YlmC with PRC-barrel domain